MASLVLGIAGAAALGPAGLAWGGALGMSGAQIGFIAGSSLGSILFAPNMPDIQGPRMGDLKVQASTYGTMIPIYYGTARGAGQVIWSSDLIETSHEEEAGGKGGPSQSVTTYTYSVNCAVGICEGEITGIRKIWANGDLIYDQSTGNMGPTGQSDNIRIYTGSETQVADSLLESYLGAGNVPAHRGIAYVVFENLQLEKFGNRIPNFSFEVVANGSLSMPSPVNISLSGESSPRYQIPHPFIDGLYLSTSIDNTDANPMSLHITDAIAKTDRSIEIVDIPGSNGGGDICYIDYGFDPVTGLPYAINEIWVSTGSYDYGYSSDIAIAYDATTLEFKRRIQPLDPGINRAWRMVFDKSVRKVLFATASSTINAGYDYLDPGSLSWDGFRNTDLLNDWYSGNSAVGENSVALSSYTIYVAFFNYGEYVHKQISSVASPYIAYDTNRNRYAWWDRNSGGFSVFRTVQDDATWAVTDYSPTTTVALSIASLNYFPAIDKYIASNTDTIYQLNADTFETENSWSIFPGAGSVYNCMEIAAMPEYIVAFVTSPAAGLGFVPITDRLAANTVTLSSIVTDICERVELAAGDIDVTQLTDEVEGYTIAQQMSARAALDGVQAAFFFDAVESN